MSNSQILREIAAEYKTVLEHQDRTPLILDHEGEAVAVLMSMEEFAKYQALLQADPFISAGQARRAANQAVFGDLVGCPLSCGEPTWIPTPLPVWRVPYRLLDGTLMCVVEVDARTGEARFTDQERKQLLAQIQQKMALLYVTPTLG